MCKPAPTSSISTGCCRGDQLCLKSKNKVLIICSEMIECCERGPYVVVLTSQQTKSAIPSVDEMDVPHMAQYIIENVVEDKSVEHVIVFLCCGNCIVETQILNALKNNGLNIGNEVFMDKMFTTAAINQIQVYSETKPEYTRRPRLVLCFKGLLNEVMFLQHRDTSLRFVILAVQGRFDFCNINELYDCHRFFCQCAKWANERFVHSEFINFLHQDKKNRDTEPCIPGSFTEVFHTSWWLFAQEIISDAAARRLLVG
jgi:hypothetical protein